MLYPKIELLLSLFLVRWKSMKLGKLKVFHQIQQDFPRAKLKLSESHPSLF